MQKHEGAIQLVSLCRPRNHSRVAAAVDQPHTDSAGHATERKQALLS